MSMSKRKHSEEMDRREFSNPFADYNGEQLLEANGKISEGLHKKLLSEIDLQLTRLYEALESGQVDASDYSVYTGSSGIAVLHLLLSQALGSSKKKEHLKKALHLIEPHLQRLKAKRISFLCGDAGPLALAAVLYDKLNRKQECTQCLDRLISYHRIVVDDTSLPDEFLFGRVGYLFGLLFVRHHLGNEVVDEAIINKIFKGVVQSGREMSRAEGSKSPLMYEWHERKYLGAAHGLSGIFYTLMLVNDSQYREMLEKYVKPSIDYLMTLRFPSGNFPSSIGSSGGDRLVHWCHGAPGWIHMFVLAYKTFGDEKYLEEAKSCGEVLWSRGLLRKGYGICHGVAGNAYGFLSLYRLTQDQRYLYRACKFAEWCFDYGKHGCRIADRPYSLFEGLAGTIHFLADLLDPDKSRFPAFEL